MDTFIQNLLGSNEFTSLLLTTFAGVVTGVVSWVAVQFRKNVKHNLSATSYALLQQIAADAVRYVEQTYKEADGPVKLAAATQAADSIISSYGLKVTVEQLNAIIEAAVYGQINQDKVPVPPPGNDPVAEGV